jgi:hypothetical protein
VYQSPEERKQEAQAAYTAVSLPPSKCGLCFVMGQRDEGTTHGDAPMDALAGIRYFHNHINCLCSKAFHQEAVPLT